MIADNYGDGRGGPGHPGWTAMWNLHLTRRPACRRRGAVARRSRAHTALAISRGCRLAGPRAARLAGPRATLAGPRAARRSRALRVIHRAGCRIRTVPTRCAAQLDGQGAFRGGSSGCVRGAPSGGLSAGRATVSWVALPGGRGSLTLSPRPQSRSAGPGRQRGGCSPEPSPSRAGQAQVHPSRSQTSRGAPAEGGVGQDGGPGQKLSERRVR